MCKGPCLMWNGMSKTDPNHSKGQWSVMEGGWRWLTWSVDGYTGGWNDALHVTKWWQHQQPIQWHLLWMASLEIGLRSISNLNRHKRKMFLELILVELHRSITNLLWLKKVPKRFEWWRKLKTPIRGSTTSREAKEDVRDPKTMLELMLELKWKWE